LDQLSVTVRQVSEFIGKVKSEILVTRRAAYGTEDNMQRLEKDKKKQDELIDQLHERLKQMKEEIKLYDGQIANQQTETKAATTTLAEAVRDMELIRIEQRDLLQKWKSALLGMANRDTALEAAEAALLKQQELLQTLDLERKGLKGTIKVAQTDNERLTGEANRLEAETKFVDGQLNGLAEKRKQLNERYTLLRSDMERTDATLRGVKATQREVSSHLFTKCRWSDLFLSAIVENVHRCIT
jgi:chromosome segregation ATPase